MAKKQKQKYRCRECGAESSKWAGQCAACGEWNCMEEVSAEETARRGGFAGIRSELTLLSQVKSDAGGRIKSGFAELDRVLGGGIVPGSVILVGGDPGVGKSTLLLQVSCRLAERHRTIYISGEESPQQISQRAIRLGLGRDRLLFQAETSAEAIIATAEANAPAFLVIDSIQTLQCGDISSAPGSVSQVREAAARLTAFAKQNNVTVFLIGHVTKSGDLAGPRVLEHIIDVVCYIEGASDNRFRMVRAVKNRYGAVNELGVFAMTDQGMREIKNPSAIFLTGQGDPMPGSSVMAVWEGSRPLLVEIQALTDESYGEHPRRVSLGLDANRLAMLLAVLHRHGSISTWNRDVFLNVVGGVRITETAADLPLLLAVASSVKNRPLPQRMVSFGEIGLAGEVRPVPNGVARLQEAAKHGIALAVVPWQNRPPKPIDGLEVRGVKTLAEALGGLLGATGPKKKT